MPLPGRCSGARSYPTPEASATERGLRSPDADPRRRPRSGFRRSRARDDVVGGARRRRRRDPDRQERRVRLRILEARRDVRPNDASTRSAFRTATSPSPACASLQQTVTAIDPETRSVTTDGGVHEADFLDRRARRRLRPGRHAGACRGRQRVLLHGWRRAVAAICFRRSRKGRAIVGVCGAPFKCPPAPSEAALLLHDYLSARGVRDDCEISFVIPFGSRSLPHRTRRARWSPPSPSATSSSSPGAASARSTRHAGSPFSTTAASCPTTSSSASRNTAPQTSSWRAEWPRTAMCP